MAPVGVLGEVNGDKISGGGSSLGGGDSILRLHVLRATGVGDGQLDAARMIEANDCDWDNALAWDWSIGGDLGKMTRQEVEGAWLLLR